LDLIQGGKLLTQVTDYNFIGQKHALWSKIVSYFDRVSPFFLNINTKKKRKSPITDLEHKYTEVQQ
jgi:hypothetical protein